MGGGQSVPDNSVTSYECNEHVATFIKNKQEYLDELKLTIRDFATCQGVTVESNIGKVKLQPLPNKLTVTSTNECKKKLDEYFQKFMSYEETMQPFSQFNSIAFGSNLRCSVQQNPFNDTVRITGVSADVKIMIRRLREALNPQSSHTAKTRASSSSSKASSTTTANSPSSSMTSQTSSNYVATLSASTPSKLLNVLPNVGVQLQASTSGITASFGINTQGSQDCAPAGIRKTERREYAPPVPESYLSTRHLYTFPAPDFSVARFIKHSKTHTLLLAEAMELLASVMIWVTQPDRKLEYRCRPVENLTLTEEAFGSTCESKLKDFLQKYTSKMRRFNHEHLMKVVAKAPEFFERQSQEDGDTVYIRWIIEENKVLLSGVLTAVEAKEKEITNFLNTTVPRTLRHAYGFDIEPPDLAVAKFVRQSEKHMSLFTEAVGDDARVSITPRKFSIHFKALIELTPIELPSFEERHTQATTAFFEKYLSWRYTYSPDALGRATNNHRDFFADEDEDVKLVINDDVEVVLIGVKQNVQLRRAKLFQIMKSYWNPNKSTPKKAAHGPPKQKEGNQHRRENKRRPLSRTFDSSTFNDWKLAPFVYQPGQRMCRDVIRHVFQSPIDGSALKHSVGPFVDFRVFPNPDAPLGVEFFAISDAQIEREYFEVQMPEIVLDFFEKFLVTTKHYRNPHELHRLRTMVDEVGHKFSVPRDMLSTYLQPDLFVAVGAREIILEISKAIGGDIIDHPPRTTAPPQRVSPQHAPPNRAPPRGGAKGPKRGAERKTRRESVESNTSTQDHPEPANKNSNQKRSRQKGNKKETKKPLLPTPPSEVKIENGDASSMMVEFSDNSKDSKPKQNKSVPQYVSYTPKKGYQQMFDLLVNNSSVFDALKSSCADFCEIEGSCPLKVTPAEPEAIENRQEFSKQVVKLMEDFLDSLSKVIIPADQILIDFFNDHKDQWLSSYFSEDDGVVLAVKPEGLEIFGFAVGVKKYKEIIEKQLEFSIEERECGMEVCRVLEVCGVLEEVNKKLSGKTEIDCSIEEGKVLFRGRACYVDYAIGLLAEKGNLIEETPALSEEKVAILNQLLLSGDRKAVNEACINAKLVENDAKGVLMVREGMVILTTMTRDCFDRCCKIIDQLIQTASLDLPEGFSPSFVESEEWKSLFSTITESQHVLCETQGTTIKLAGLDGANIQQASEKIESFLKESSVETRAITCSAHVGRFIIKYFVNTDVVPQAVQINEFKKGINITGPAAEVEKVVTHLRRVQWHRTKFLFSAPNLDAYFSSAVWESFVKYLESIVRCTVAYDVGKAQDLLEELEAVDISASSQSRAPSFGSPHVSKTATYGNVSVSVGSGDITRDDSDVIINGVTRDFDLTRGTVSPALLRMAGPKMQEQCNSDPVMSSSVIRVTRGWNLLCDHVIHLVTPHTEEKLKSRIKEALDYAEMLKASSVAMPTLGAGGIGLNATTVSSAMSEAFELFVSEKPQFVKTIKVIVYDGGLLDLFESSIVKSKAIMGFGKREALAVERKAKRSVLCDKVTILVNAEDEASLNEAKLKIDAHMSEKVTTKPVKDDLLAELDDHDCIDIYQAAVKHNVTVTFKNAKSEILLSGMCENVRELYDFVRELFFELRESMTVSKQVVWKWAGSSKQFTALPLRVSRAIEREFEKSKRGTHYIGMYGTILEVNLSTMAYEFNHVVGQLKRVDSVTEQISPDWTDMMGKTWLKVDLSSDSSEYKRVTDLFKSSNPPYNSILSIERIQHPSLYKQYLIKKNDVERHMLSDHPVERELFHGTSQDDAEKICADGFDRNFAGKNATVYGKGTYFAVNSTYSVNYATRSASGRQYLFLARVLTGDFCKGHHDIKAPPKKSHSSDIVRLYDSVVDTEANPSIFVVFKDSSVYPYYLISFC